MARPNARRADASAVTRAGSLRELRQRRTSVSTIKKVTRAMELIAASRIIKAQQRAQAAAPYARELTRAVSAVATYSNVEHPLTTEKPRTRQRAAVLLITSDRGLAGAYSSSVIREGEQLTQLLRENGKDVVPVPDRPKGAPRSTPSGAARSPGSGRGSPTRRRTRTPARSPTR